VKNIGKPCAGKSHARFDEGGMVETVMVRIMRHRRTKGAETDRPNLKPQIPSLYSTLYTPHFAFPLLLFLNMQLRFICKFITKIFLAILFS